MVVTTSHGVVDVGEFGDFIPFDGVAGTVGAEDRVGGVVQICFGIVSGGCDDLFGVMAWLVAAESGGETAMAVRVLVHIHRIVAHLGHRRLAFIHGEKTAVTENRLAGFYQACEELGLKVPEEYVRCGVYHDVDRCAEETRALLALPQRPTCIIFPDDFSALGGYNALSEAGLSIPEDISVMGYDGIYLSRVVKPSLVTYQQNTKSLGRLAADKLIELIEHPRVTLPEQIRVSGKLLDGGSVRIL